MGYAYSSPSRCLSLPNNCSSLTTLSTHKSIYMTSSSSSSSSSSYNPTPATLKTHTQNYPSKSAAMNLSSVEASKIEEKEIRAENHTKPTFDAYGIDQGLLQKLVHHALVWSSLHGLVVGDRHSQRSGKIPGVGMVHAPFSLLPKPFPESHWKQASEVAPIFNELIHRVSLDTQFLQSSLSRTKKVDAFTSRLLDIHMMVVENNKKEDICLGLHRSDYMLDEQTKLLLQIELNTIASSFPGLSCLVSELHKSLLSGYGAPLGLESKRIPPNDAASHYAKALAKAWAEYNNSRSVVMFVVQSEERNMYDQHWLSSILWEKHGVTSIRKTLAEVDAEGELQPDGALIVGGREIAVIYFRAGYAPSDYPTESEWGARLLMEQSSAIKCPSISYHLAGTKKIQQELAKPKVLERFLENTEDIAKLRKCFAGLWSLDDSCIVKDAIERPELFVMKPQREGGGNNIYGDDVRKTLLRLQKDGSEENAAFILMQRIFPIASPAYLMRDGVCHKDQAISEVGIYGVYLRNKSKVIMNEASGYLVRTKVSSSNEGGVAAGFAVLDSLYLT